MSFLDLARLRESVRHYTGRAVDVAAIERCLEAAMLAPSACNSQPWFFVVVNEPELRARVAGYVRDAVMNKFVTEAPVLIAVVAETPSLIPRMAGHWKNKPYWLMDIGMAVENLCLQAADEGLGTCIIGWFNEMGVRDALGIPKGKRIPLVITLGHGADAGPRPKQRKSPEETWSFNAFRRE